jgi:hypothetical protein
MVEGYSILGAKTQEVQPWPDIGGRGVYLNFSGNVHMDAAILEIPEGKALIQRHHLAFSRGYSLSPLRGLNTTDMLPVQLLDGFDRIDLGRRLVRPDSDDARESQSITAGVPIALLDAIKGDFDHNNWFH